MKGDTLTKLEKQYGGMWVATSKSRLKVYASGKTVSELFDNLKQQNIEPTKTVIGYMQQYGQTYILPAVSR